MGIGFGRPMNSKFGYFENSHPGQAMAITEEELEKEMSSTRLITAYKNQPTTTGGISTWILLNPPSTTVKTTDTNKKTKLPVETEVRVTAKPVKAMERVETTEKVIEKLTSTVAATTMPEEVNTTTKKPVVATTKRTTPDGKPEKTEKPGFVQTTTLKVSQSSENHSESKGTVTSVGTTKKIQVVRTTPKPKITTSKITVLPKTSTLKTTRPNQQTRLKPSTRRTTIKPDIVRNENASTAKIEKVTFKPIQMITTTKPKVETTEKPMFVTKIKASILMDTQKTITASPVSSSTSDTNLSTTNKPSLLSSTDLPETSVKPKPVGTKVNNVLKVQLKKPLDEVTTMELEPVKVSAQLLKTEKNDKNNKVEEIEKDTDDLGNSKIDLKFDFNPELTKINVETSTEILTSTTSSTTTSTTKRPRHNSKRKKNKVRRRKPTTPSTSTTTVSTITLPSSTTEMEPITELLITPDIGIQESKIAPETKIATNSTKTKKKTPQKPISTQIYNFLSREVMPSFGMMSLVGLGLGLASYFLYPFGGTISRRNYEVEPKYKYNLEEYGGNYGQSEEEVLAKVLQGMTGDDGKYQGTKDFDNNYYRYQHYDGSYDSQTTRKTDQRYSSPSPMYRPENTASGLKYRNTNYRYPETQTTPNYYDRSKHPDYTIGQETNSADRQFVVGNVPKEYPSYGDKNQGLSTSGKITAGNYEPTESGQTQFDRDMGQNYNFQASALTSGQNYHQGGQTSRPEEGYDEIEINPTAVAVEHGPRSLKVKRSISGSLKLRKKRDSVIQVIPSKRELEEEEKEEDLSNEILDIIDAALPGGEPEKPKKRREDNEVEDLEAQRRKKIEEERTRLKESTMKTPIVESSTSSVNSETTQESTSSATKDSSESLDSSSESSASSEGSAEDSGSSTTSSPKSTEESNVEWIDLTTKAPAEENNFNLFSFVKKVAEIKFRLGLTLLKHASEGFARYLGHVQKRINGDE